MTASAVRTYLRGTRCAAQLAIGAASYWLHQVTPPHAYQAMIQLFCLTGGRSNDWISRLIGLVRRPHRLPSAKGVLGDMEGDRLEGPRRNLTVNGYHVFDRLLEAEVRERIVKFALSHPATVRTSDNATDRVQKPMRVIYDPDRPLGVVYDFDPEDLINHPDVQALVVDPSVIALAQNYIGAQPVLDEVNLWWSTAYSHRPDANAAQLYHFDMDRIRWVKFFIYLTDVASDNGPHCFVSGSHRSGGIPRRFLDRGYVRLSDAEVRAEVPPERLIEFTGPAGTIIAEDTRGLHKGKPLRAGHRLVLEFEFSNSMFGANPLKTSRLKTFHEPAARDWMFSHRRLYSRWLDERS